MSVTGLLDVLLDERAGDPALRSAVEAARSGAHTALDLTAPAGIRPFLLAAVAGPRRPAGARGHRDRPGGRGAGDRPARPARRPTPSSSFPAWETLPHERLSPRSDTVGRRLAVLRRLAHPDADGAGHGPVQVVVAPVRAVLQPMVAGLGDLEPVVAARR